MGYLDLPYQFGILWMSTFSLLEWSFTKYNIFYMILTNSSERFWATIFLQKLYFHKKIFLLNHIFWEYFLDYKDLPYQFGILRMSTFCWSQWFNTSSTRICIVHTNVSKLFFRTDLMKGHCSFFHASCNWQRKITKNEWLGRRRK